MRAERGLPEHRAPWLPRALGGGPCHAAVATVCDKRPVSGRAGSGRQGASVARQAPEALRPQESHPGGFATRVPLTHAVASLRLSVRAARGLRDDETSPRGEG